MLIIKVGGGKDINWDYICQDIAQLKQKIVLVHGANWEMDKIAKKLGQPPKTIISPSGFASRYTNQETLEILTMVYSGLVNKRVVSKLQSLGINAIGLSGVDGRIWQGQWKKVILAKENGKTKAIRDNYQGKVTQTNSALIKLLSSKNYLPVITIPAISQENKMINVDNDRAVAVMAKDLAVKKLVILFEAPGLLKDPKNESSLIKKVNIKNIDDYYKYAQGKMKKKLMGAKEAFKNGVEQIYWFDGRLNNPVTRALKGEGTTITK